MRRFITILMIGLLSTLVAQGQIRIGGNVYGGGNHAEVQGSTKVTVKAGDIGAVLDPKAIRPVEDPQGKVFGGARMANVGGNTFVHIDGENATDYILINQVYGGNDIAGTIGTGTIPDKLTAVKSAMPPTLPEGKTEEHYNDVDNTFNSFVRISTKATNEHYTQNEINDASTNPEAPAYGKRISDVKPDPTAKKVYIGQLFAGGNGDFDYEQVPGPTTGKVTHSIYNWSDIGHDYPIAQKVTDEGEVGFQRPELDKTYLEILGGSIVYGYGGGNNATVKTQNIIHIDNPSAVVNHIKVDATGKEDANGTDLLITERFKEMGINTTFSKPESGEYQVGRFFGGNNKAEMSIRPTWNLLAGKVRNLYSGGNKGSMTYPEGLLLEIKDYSSLIVDNLYGGCRMADVKPTKNGVYNPCNKLDGYDFDEGLSARVLIAGGHINNVYGGNDVTGTVYGGNAVCIHTTVYGDVYGGGNGFYPYTDVIGEDDPNLGDIFGDFHYGLEGYSSSEDALNAFRPNAEQVFLHLWGESASKPTVIHGSVFVGGNCASLDVKKDDPLIALKMGSYVVANSIYLGNNGEGMIDKFYLDQYADGSFSTLNLTNSLTFAKYMEGVAMKLKKTPDIVFDKDYIENSSYVGSFFCGGNVGSMAIGGKMTFNISRGLNIYNKFVGGCNNADVAAQSGLNAAYEGGVIGSSDERDNYTDGSGNIKDRLEINFWNLTMVPMRWNDTFAPIVAADLKDGKLIEGREYYTSNLQDTKFIAEGTEVVNLEAADKYYKKTSIGNDFEWNTGEWSIDEKDFVGVANNAVNADTRLLKGNIYGGCYNSGHVNGNVVINIEDDVLKKDEIFGTGKSGVDFVGQRDDVMTSALSVFGAGYGEKTEVWGSTTVNHKKGYAFQIFGGGELGVVGKKEYNSDGAPVLVPQTDENNAPVLDTEGNPVYEYKYDFDPRYSATVNLNGNVVATSNEGAVTNLAEAEFIYGGGNKGDVCGNTRVNLFKGRVYDAFGGACDADILGHAEVYVGDFTEGFPWIRNNIYGGNDFGGRIEGKYESGYNFEARLRNYDTDKTQLHGYAGNVPEVLKGSTYVEYRQGRVNDIFGGGYGFYDYTKKALYGASAAMPEQHSSFVNIRPKYFRDNQIKAVFGGGTGYPGIRDDDKKQDCSYVLIDILDGDENFGDLEVFGSGSYNGVGMDAPKPTNDDSDGNKTAFEAYKNYLKKPDEYSAIVDLLRGRINNVYGGSYNEGITRRTVVNVPAASTIQIDNIFGGAFGTQILPPCDVYETQVNYKNTSENALVKGAIYGGNNNERRSLFTQVNISSPVWKNKAEHEYGKVFGAGRGIDTWSEYTEVNLLSGARLSEVFGGGEMGHVLNTKSIQVYMQTYQNTPSQQISTQDSRWNQDKYWNLDDQGKKVSLKTGKLDESDEKTIPELWREDWKNAWTIGNYYVPNDGFSNYASNESTNLSHVSERSELDDKTAGQLDGKKYNTNVIVNKGAIVEGYAYGGGFGDASEARTGDVYGNTYIAILGGEVKKDVFAGGQAGGLDNLFEASGDVGFVASANAYVQGGTVRNVYGGGYEGHVGHHEGTIDESFTGDRFAKTHVVIGKTDTNTFDGGSPAILRNVYGGGEGGSVYGSTNVTINNGYIGYRYADNAYVEELDDRGQSIDLAGNVFGGGYVVNSYVDNTQIDLFGGTIRGSVFGGGEVGPIGRGANKTGLGKGGIENGDATIFRAGTTLVNMYNGHVLRNVFGGGRGKESWGTDGTKYMDKNLVASLKADGLFCKGYVFGQTRVNIHGGEIGTEEGMAFGYGNVFGGCDEGLVYSAYMDGNNLRIGKQDGYRYDGTYEGYYYEYDGSKYLTEENSNKRKFTEDCKVVVEPYAQAIYALTIPNGGTYDPGDYVPVSDLDKLKDKNSDSNWACLDPFGIIIHNAVFAGGNLAQGSSSVFVNAKTVFGNATASIHDVYNRDLITIGTGHTGGLYGDGNLTSVDGYRELNITNYGTDYYHIKSELSYGDYENLPTREKAYYELKYKLKAEHVTDNAGTTYSKGSTLPEDEILVLFEGQQDMFVNGKPNPAVWEKNGVVSVYAGRIMNTIQRADFCGVFGSRMVMKGAPDRVPEEQSDVNYTINRVREVSLNKKVSVNGGDIERYTAEDETADPSHKEGTYKDPKAAEHGNYFGIYSNVNYLGALTSDVKFSDIRTTKSDDSNCAADGTTFYQWKAAHIRDKSRNNGNCRNQLALASGVHLELTTEKSTGNTLGTKDWGYITGVVELDLINVQPGMGGGFVYAKNVHGMPRTPEPAESSIPTSPLTALNKGAASKSEYVYEDIVQDKNTQQEWETSGNFIHSSQTIIDDCYNISNRYKLGEDPVPAHYWYISGTVYVYDQYITAYTGSPNAYSEKVDIPITINAAANGRMTLMDVQPNYYAYYSTSNKPLTGEQEIVINDIHYKLNQPISYWDWYKLPAAEKGLFKRDTYVVIEDCKIGSTVYTAGTVLLKEEYDDLIDNDVNGDPVYPTVTHKRLVDGEEQDVEVPFTEVFRSSNNMSHTTGYLLTYKVTNPKLWEDWFTEANSSSSSRAKNQTGGDGYIDGPTYHPTESGLYGQQEYKVSAIISQNEYRKYNGYDKDGDGKFTGDGDVYGLRQMYAAVDSRTDQATFVPAYLTTSEYTDNENNIHYYSGAPVSQEISGYTAPAYVCTASIKLSENEYIYVNDLMTASKKTEYYNRFINGSEADKLIAKEIDDLIVPAYYCTTAGLYGGSYYKESQNYRGLEAYCAMSPEDRKKFTFNYDALDLLIDPTYGKTQGQKYQYDSAAADLDGAEANDAQYSLTTPIDYSATYNSESTRTLTSNISLKRNGNPISTNVLQKGDELLGSVYESLPNERHHYTPIKVDVEGGTYYVVKKSFVHGATPYAVGTTISEATFNSLSSDEQSEYITSLGFDADEVKKDASGNILPFYYCREDYTVNSSYYTAPQTGAVKSVKGVGIGTTYNTSVPAGIVIEASDYNNLINQQTNFIIHGESPVETSTLYVARNADINDLSTEKIITVIYKYDYEESDTEGMHITPVSERHVVNIHITFKSGLPIVPDIPVPGIVLPGTSITLPAPVPTPGEFLITGTGWEIFESPSDADSHINGVEYTPTQDPLYWYQDGFLLAYYAKTVIGRAYSNAVPISVANYHDLKDVMEDKQYHLHVDYDRTRLKRDSKIYINDYSKSSKNGLDLFKDFYDLSLLTTAPTTGDHLEGHSLLNNSTDEVTMLDGTKIIRGVKGGQNLEFFLRTDIDYPDNPDANDWTSIGTDDVCFKGTLHGDGHTISGLDHSLFNNLCGEVYNLGVTGSFQTAGVADKDTEKKGYVESCWVKTSATTPLATKPNAVFGNPTDTEGYQLVNSYFLVDNKDLYNNVSTNATTGITTSGGDRGKATAKSAKAYYNGELAYDLNNFYLYKRYANKKGTVDETNLKDRYFTIDDDGKRVIQPYKSYESRADLCSSGYTYTPDGETSSVTIKYVEDRFADGDFRYAAGEIPESEDERYLVETETNASGEEVIVSKGFYPIWPDDYIFFGQKLTYGWSPDEDKHPHQDVPTAVARFNGRLSQGIDANRVYRAPAYYRSKEMGVYHFNPTAYLAFKSADQTNSVTEKPMTAIDFAGHYENNAAYGTYGLGNQTGHFYTPLLDDDGLLSIQNCDETKNLLVYAPAESAESGYVNAKTHGVLAKYFKDPDYMDYFDNSHYKCVAEASVSDIYGHLVQSNKKATNDHLLVDKEDFNAPIAYTFDSSHRMWYQRKPVVKFDAVKAGTTLTKDKIYYLSIDGTGVYQSNGTEVANGTNYYELSTVNYVGYKDKYGNCIANNAGWDAISLPFTAELVTTDVKGEITHFYQQKQDGDDYKYTKDYDSGHEYWLREFRGVLSEEGNVMKANLSYPEEDTTDKVVENTFLWDYYYNEMVGPHHEDLNNDKYQTYYKTNRTYSKYPRLAGGTSYIIGFPGGRYYEFDLSGTFAPTTTSLPDHPAKLDPQIITFASNAGASINVSDNETIPGENGFNSDDNSHNGYTFRPSYMNERISSGTNTYTLKNDGSQFDKVPEAAAEGQPAVPDTEVYAFRPYFLKNTGGSTRTIIFGNEQAEEQKGVEEVHGDPTKEELNGGLRIWTKKNKIYVESSLSFTEDMRVVTPAGITVATFSVKPGKTVEVKADFSGMYIVHTLDGLYTKKVTVRK